ncbi:hypothetical protein MTO96_015042 [Rhipicephalus appendiculatus]
MSTARTDAPLHLLPRPRRGLQASNRSGVSEPLNIAMPRSSSCSETKRNTPKLDSSGFKSALFLVRIPGLISGINRGPPPTEGPSDADAFFDHQKLMFPIGGPHITARKQKAEERLYSALVTQSGEASMEKEGTEVNGTADTFVPKK